MIESIFAIIEKNLTREKTLICNDSASFHFISRRLLRKTSGLANFSSDTVAGLASRCSGFFMIEEGGRPLKAGEGFLVLQEMINPSGYFGASLAMPGFMLALWNSVMQMRLAEIDPEKLDEKTIGNMHKASELAGLLRKFQNYLEENNRYDYARVLKTCISKRFIENYNGLVLLPGNLSLTPLEEKFLAQAGERLVHLPWPAPEEMQTPQTWRASTRHAAFADNKVACLHPESDTRIFCATEPEAEIREIIRRIRTAAVPFEQIAIAPAGAAGYSGLISSLLQISGIPYSLSLPRKIDEFRPGRLAMSLCQWASDGFPASSLIAMLNQGDLRLFRSYTKKQREQGKRSISSQKIISMLRQAHVRGGRDGYEKPLLAVGEEAAHRGKPNILRQARRIINIIAQLTENFPDAIAPGDAAVRLRNLLAKFTRVTQEEDVKRLSRIKKQLESYRNIATPLMPLSRAMWWLQLVLRQESEQEPFRPDGKVVITTPQAAVMSGRCLLFFPGLTHSAMPGSPATDPVIPDNARKLLPPLKTAEETRAETLAALYSAWAGFNGNARIVFSMPLVDANGRAMSPAEPFTRVLHSKKSGNEEFSSLVGTPTLPLTGYLAESGNEAVDFGEWLWHKRRAGYDREFLRELFERAYPHWTKYKISQELRKSGQSKVTTGLPDWQPEKWDYRNNPEVSLSASGIEELSGCQYAYFLSHVIGCMPWEQISSAGLQGVAWLDSAQRGKLLHEIYEVFLERAGWPIDALQKHMLEQVVDEITEKYRNLIPPAGLSAFVVGRAAILRDAEEFFAKECEASATGKTKPVGFELMFGMKLPEGKKNPLGLDTVASVPFTMRDNSRISLKGMVDRIDETPEGLKIWDYKTGAAHNYQKGGLRAEQATLQLAVYKYAVASLLADAGDKRKVAGAGLYFPTVAGQGQRIITTDGNEQEIINNRLEGLFDFLTAGRFPAYNMCEDCNALNLCPYAKIVGEQQVEESGEE